MQTVASVMIRVACEKKVERKKSGKQKKWSIHLSEKLKWKKTHKRANKRINILKIYIKCAVKIIVVKRSQKKSSVIVRLRFFFVSSPVTI